MMGLGVVLWILGVVAMIWVIYDVWVEKKKFTMTRKVVWTVLALLLSILAALAYYLIEYNKKN